MPRSSRSAAVVCAAAAAGVTLLASVDSARATPYASGVSESAGNVSFVLNEDAQDVVVYLDGVPTHLGSTTAGTVSFSRGGAASWQVQVIQSGGLGFGSALPSFATGNTALSPLAGVLQSQADSSLTRFNSPRGVDVNTSTSDLSLFGRVYVGNSQNASSAINTQTPGVGATLPSRATAQKGLYVLDSHLGDTLAQGNTARTAGLTFDSGSSSPYRVAIGADGMVYIADWSDANGSVYYANADVTSGGNLLVGKGSSTEISPSASLNHGSIAGLGVTGSFGSSLTLYTVDEDLKETGATTNTQHNSVWQYAVGPSAGGYSGTPTRLATPISNTTATALIADLTVAPDGKIFVTDQPSDTSKRSLVVLSSAGTVLWDSEAQTIALGLDADPVASGTQDVLRRAQAVTVSRDGKYVGVLRTDNSVWVLPLDPVTGLPDLSRRHLFNGFGTGTLAKDVAFDAADNLYVVSDVYHALRVFSPGGTSVTSLSSDGTFSSQAALTPEWQNSGSDTTSNAANWPLAVTPNGSGAFAKYGAAITSNATVTLGSATTYGYLIFDNPSYSFTLSGGLLTIDTPAYQTPTLYVASGSHEIAAATTLNRTTTFSLNSGTSLTFSAGVTGPGGLTVNGGTAVTGGSLLLSAPVDVGALAVRGNTRSGFKTARRLKPPLGKREGNAARRPRHGVLKPVLLSA